MESGHFERTFQWNFSARFLKYRKHGFGFHESNFARKPCTVYLFRFKITVCIVFNNGMRSMVLEI